MSNSKHYKRPATLQHDDRRRRPTHLPHVSSQSPTSSADFPQSPNRGHHHPPSMWSYVSGLLQTLVRRPPSFSKSSQHQNPSRSLVELMSPCTVSMPTSQCSSLSFRNSNAADTEANQSPPDSTNSKPIGHNTLPCVSSPNTGVYRLSPTTDVSPHHGSSHLVPKFPRQCQCDKCWYLRSGYLPVIREQADKENEMAPVLNWPGPRTVFVPRTDHGFGFTLRHFIVYPPESAVSAQFNKSSPDCEADQIDGTKRKKTRLSSLEPMDTIFVRQVKEFGPAHKAGLNTGDRIVSVNGESVTGKTYSQVIALIQATDNTLQLLVVPKDEDILQMTYQHASSNQGREAHQGNTADIPPPPHISRLTRMQTASYAALKHDDTHRPAGIHQPTSRSQAHGQHRSESDSTCIPDQRQFTKGISPKSVFAVTDSTTADYVNVPALPSKTYLDRKDNTQRVLSSYSTNQDPGVHSSRNSDHGFHSRQSSRNSSENVGVGFYPSQSSRNSSENIGVGFHPSQPSRNSSGTIRQVESSDSSNRVDAPAQSSKWQEGNGLNRKVDYAGSNSSLSSHGSGYIVREPRHSSHSNVRGVAGYNKSPDSDFLESDKHADSFVVRGQPHIRTSNQEKQVRALLSESAPKTPPRKSSKTSLQQYIDHSSGFEKSHQVEFRESQENTLPPQFVSPNFSSHSSIMLQSAGPELMSDDHLERTFQLRQSKTMENLPDQTKPDSSTPTHRTVVTYRKSRTTPALVGAGDADTRYNPNRGSRLVPVSSHASIMVSPPYRSLNITHVSANTASPATPFSSPSCVDTSDSLDTTTSTVSTTGVRFLPAYKERFEVPKPHVRILQKKYQKSRSDGMLTRDRPLVTIHQGQSDSQYSQNTLTYSLKFNEAPVSVDNMAAPPCEKRVTQVEVPISSLNKSKPEPPHIKASLSTKSGHHIDFEDPKHLSIAIRRKRDVDADSGNGTITSASNVYYKEKNVGMPSSLKDPSAVMTTSFLSENIFDDQPEPTADLAPSPRSVHKDVPVYNAEEYEERRGAKPFRQPSYLTAMHSPTSKASPTSAYSRNSAWRSTLPRSWGRMRNKSITFSDAMAKAALMTATDDTSSGVSSSTDDTNRVRMMTGEDTTSMTSSVSPDNEGVIRRAKEPDESDSVEDVPYEVTDTSGTKVVRRTSYLMATGHDRGTVHSPVEESIPEVPSAGDQFQTPQAKSNIKKLKNFFGEKTPRIVEATDRKPSVSNSLDTPLSPVQDVSKEGILQCKIAITDGKRASDRSWKPMWAALRGHALYLFRDRKDTSVVPGFSDDQPLSVKSSIVDIAYDYTKKKHVFRLTTFNGSEYLFQAEDHEDMLGWINGIQTNSNPDHDCHGVANTELILRKTAQLEQSVKSPPQAPSSSKGMKKITSLSFRRGSPGGGHSPGVKPRKNEDGQGKEEKAKTWRGKMAKSFKRLQSSSGATITEEITGTFGVNLEDCIPSSDNEFVPLVVEMCCTIVEERGLEFTGIYRVPGNTAAVNMLQEELNKGIINGENEKWLDVNVVGSLLKSFFRKLPDPLITEDLYQSFIKANRLKDPEKRMLTLKRLIHELPDYNYDTFRYLANHLHKVSSFSHLNKMDSRNLAIVFGPTLVRAMVDNMLTMVEDMSDQCRIVESVIHHCEWIFGSWDVDVNVPIDLANPDSTSPVSGMNDILTKIAKNEDSESVNSGSSVSRKDIVTSIIQAANKKIKKKDKDKKGSVDLDASGECGFEERNIDEIVAARRLKMQNHETSTKEPVDTQLTTHLDPQTTNEEQEGDIPRGIKSEGRSNSTDFSDSSESRQTDSILSEVLSAFQKDYSQTNWSASVDSNVEEESVDKTSQQVVVDKSNYVYPPTRNSQQPIKSWTDQSSEHDVEVMYFGSRSTNQNHERSRRLEFEAKILRAKEAENQKEQEKREVERQRIEEELQKTRQELESDDISLEDVDAKPSVLALKISDITNKINDLSHADSSSVTSDYSTTSSSNIETRASGSVRKQSSSDYSSSASPTGSHEKRRKLSDITKSANTSIDYHGTKDMPKLSLASKITEPKPRTDKAASDLQKLYGKARHSSLYTSGPSVASRVNAFEEKKAPLSAYRRSASASIVQNTLEGARSIRRNSMENNKAIFENLATGHSKPRKWSDSRSISIKNEERPRSPFVRVGSGYRRRGSLDSLRDFYDRETKRSSYASSTSEDGHDLLHSITATFDQKLQVLVNPKYHLDVEKPRPSSHIETTDSKGSTDASDAKDSDRGLRKSKSAIGVFDTFKDPSLHRLPRQDAKIGIASRFERPRTEGSSVSSRTREISERKLSHPQVRVLDDMVSDYATQETAKPDDTAGKCAVVRRRNKRKELRRRHTVGGMKDFDQFKEILNNQTTQTDVTQLSAWERLQPAVKPENVNELKSMKNWMEHQRLRTSDTDLNPVNLSKPAQHRALVIESMI